MNNCYTASQKTDDALSGRSLKDAYSNWLLYGELEGWSQRTIDDRRMWLVRLGNFLQRREFDFDAEGLRQFIIALQRGYADAGCLRPLKPVSVTHVWTLLRAFCNWMVEERLVSDSPMRRIPRPIDRSEQKGGFSDEELGKLLAAAEKTRNHLRDTALVHFLADTGVRASECVSLVIGDIDLSTRTALIRRGKGGKARTVAFGKGCAMALWQYLKKENREKDEPLFLSERSAALTLYGIGQFVRRLGKAAGVEGAHTHRFRHDCAIRLLRGGAHVFNVMSQLGHSQIVTTQGYVRLAERDVREMARSSSPIDRLKARK